MNSTLSSSTATWNFVVGHYPIFGSNVQYGVNDSSAFPGEFSGWAMVRTLDRSAPWTGRGFPLIVICAQEGPWLGFPSCVPAMGILCSCGMLQDGPCKLDQDIRPP